ncbi:hypothetical protein G6O67_008304 [Ophiocordyceps sinensis]|uniref:CCHC-type domain-containing protein n=1 Tax=Ophiocordyceps sinensis TaxID=72228 RepID=A0A8H4PKQ8_9HYPO|nr:hypothetical protein G6O67_008304 [Ophiocordyceps sinensis]
MSSNSTRRISSGSRLTTRNADVISSVHFDRHFENDMIWDPVVVLADEPDDSLIWEEVYHITQALRNDASAYTLETLSSSLIDEFKRTKALESSEQLFFSNNNNNNNKIPVCSNCKKRGHLEKNCFWKPENKDKAKAAGFIPRTTTPSNTQSNTPRVTESRVATIRGSSSTRAPTKVPSI